MSLYPLFRPPPEPPEKDAAPLAGGACVNESFQPKFIPDLPAPYMRNGPETSEAAARAVNPRAGTRRVRVLEHIRECGRLGATDAEIQEALGLGPQSVSPRRGELARLGLVVDSGFRRETPSGCRAIVWLAFEHDGSEGV